MSDYHRDELVVDVADALTLDQEVEWERCARLATPANRHVLDNLRAFSGIFSGGPRGAGDARLSGAASWSELYSGRLMRLAVQALVAFAALEVAASLTLVVWGWDDIHREYGERAVFMAALVGGYAVSACLFLSAGRRDRRTWLLGVYFLLKATLTNPFVLLAFLLGVPPTEPFGYPNFAHPYVYPFMFAPAFLWAFARECPRVRRRTRLDDLARRMVGVSVSVGCLFWIGGVALLGLSQAGDVDPAVFWVGHDGSLAVLDLLGLGAVAVVVLRAPTAPADEARRVAVFGMGLLLCVGLAAAYDVVEVFSPGDWLSNLERSPAVVAVELLRFPGLLALWYAVLAVRVPHPREAVRASCRRLLVRGRLLGAAAVAAGLSLGWLVASRPERTVGAILGDPLLQSLAAVAGVLLLVVATRRQILVGLDAWLVPETTDQRQAVARAAAALAKAERIGAVSRTVNRAAVRGCSSPATLLVAADTGSEAQSLCAPDARMTPLPRASLIAHVLETAGGPLRVHPDDETSFFGLLPEDDAAWVVETGADVIVPLPGPGAEPLGVMVVGRRLDGRVVRRVDLPFLEALGAAAGQAVVRLLRAPGTGSAEAPPARECPVCRRVTGPGDPPACDCGPAYEETDVPKLLAGRYQLARRLGSGGMGRVYLARDLRLERDVAVKTLMDMSVSRLMGLKPEAWAMATVAHPAVAQIYGIESWRDRPFLIVEFLAGGTLADLLRGGPLPASEAVSVAALLADALAALHETGYVHGDVKPSNVGLTANGSPKLLDFGLARAANDAATRGGTLRYLSPEVLSGRAAEEADDVWSLCVILYEMASGGHPFAGGGIDEVAGRIRRQRLDAATWAAIPGQLAFVASMLTATRSARPATAHAFAEALREVAGVER